MQVFERTLPCCMAHSRASAQVSPDNIRSLMESDEEQEQDEDRHESGHARGYQEEVWVFTLYFADRMPPCRPGPALVGCELSLKTVPTPGLTPSLCAFANMNSHWLLGTVGSTLSMVSTV